MEKIKSIFCQNDTIPCQNPLFHAEQEISVVISGKKTVFFVNFRTPGVIRSHPAVSKVQCQFPQFKGILHLDIPAHQ